ncbi:MAG: hypothetical protein M1817_000537 [Caeruleum heppii]|nr:MAG: hypothetical protein M1817_000537 [Caeruleum heppii]
MKSAGGVPQKSDNDIDKVGGPEDFTENMEYWMRDAILGEVDDEQQQQPEAQQQQDQQAQGAPPPKETPVSPLQPTVEDDYSAIAPEAISKSLPQSPSPSSSPRLAPVPEDTSSKQELEQLKKEISTLQAERARNERRLVQFVAEKEQAERDTTIRAAELAVHLRQADNLKAEHANAENLYIERIAQLTAELQSAKFAREAADTHLSAAHEATERADKELHNDRNSHLRMIEELKKHHQAAMEEVRKTCAEQVASAEQENDAAVEELAAAKAEIDKKTDEKIQCDREKKDLRRELGNATFTIGLMKNTTDWQDGQRLREEKILTARLANENTALRQALAMRDAEIKSAKQSASQLDGVLQLNRILKRQLAGKEQTEDLTSDLRTELEKLQGENERLKGHIGQSNQLRAPVEHSTERTTPSDVPTTRRENRGISEPSGTRLINTTASDHSEYRAEARSREKDLYDVIRRLEERLETRNESFEKMRARAYEAERKANLLPDETMRPLESAMKMRQLRNDLRLLQETTVPRDKHLAELEAVTSELAAMKAADQYLLDEHSVRLGQTKSELNKARAEVETLKQALEAKEGEQEKRIVEMQRLRQQSRDAAGERCEEIVRNSTTGLSAQMAQLTGRLADVERRCEAEGRKATAEQIRANGYRMRSRYWREQANARQSENAVLVQKANEQMNSATARIDKIEKDLRETQHDRDEARRAATRARVDHDVVLIRHGELEKQLEQARRDGNPPEQASAPGEKAVGCACAVTRPVVGDHTTAAGEVAALKKELFGAKTESLFWMKKVHSAKGMVSQEVFEGYQAQMRDQQQSWKTRLDCAQEALRTTREELQALQRQSGRMDVEAPSLDKLRKDVKDFSIMMGQRKDLLSPGARIYVDKPIEILGDFIKDPIHDEWNKRGHKGSVADQGSNEVKSDGLVRDTKATIPTVSALRKTPRHSGQDPPCPETTTDTPAAVNKVRFELPLDKEPTATAPARVEASAAEASANMNWITTGIKDVEAGQIRPGETALDWSYRLVKEAKAFSWPTVEEVGTSTKELCKARDAVPKGDLEKPEESRLGVKGISLTVRLS